MLDFDQNHLSETQDMLGHDGYAKMLSKFDAEAAEFMDWVTPAQPNEDIAVRAHKVAGAAAIFGATGFRQALLTLEQAAKAGNGAEVETLLAEVLKTGKAARQHLSQTRPTDQD